MTTRQEAARRIATFIARGCACGEREITAIAQDLLILVADEPGEAKGEDVMVQVGDCTRPGWDALNALAAERSRADSYEAALRGVQGIDFADGYSVNVADLRHRADKAEAEVAALQADCARISKELGLPSTMTLADGEFARIWGNMKVERDLARAERDALKATIERVKSIIAGEMMQDIYWGQKITAALAPVREATGCVHSPPGAAPCADCVPAPPAAPELDVEAAHHAMMLKYNVRGTMATNVKQRWFDDIRAILAAATRTK